MLDFFKTPKLYWHRFILIFIRPFYIRHFKLKEVGLENVPEKGPYLIVANHSHLLDPFFIGTFIKRPVFQMASNEFFRKPIVRRFMWAMGAFPRKKGFTDFKSIKYAIHLVRRGYPLIIYPEGGRNWDGETLPITKSIAKLVKLLNVPLITVVSKGNYIAYPRWAYKRRKSPITVYYSKPVTFKRNIRDEEIIKYIEKGIYNNDNYTKIDKIRGKNPARGLYRLLYRCPECRDIDTLKEKDGKTIVCNNCGTRWEVNLKCYMKKKGDSKWIAIKEYSDQMFKEEEIIPLPYDAAFELDKNESIYLKSKQVLLYHEPYYPKIEKLGYGKTYLTNKRIVFVREKDDKVFSYPFENIRGRSTEQNNFFQITLDDDIARFEMLNESPYKWEIIYDYLRSRVGYKEKDRIL